MARDVHTIRIESILGGHSPTTHFAAPDQFRSSLGINPALAIDSNDTAVGTIASGLLRPNAGSPIPGDTINDFPCWIVTNPKLNKSYVYDHGGSIYSIGANGTPITAIGDLNDGGFASGNGAAYYDNYIYFARNTTVARYGPLDGTPAFTDDYWSSTLSKTALANTSYPYLLSATFSLPNHVMHRHSDGILYFADVVGNQGTIHYIKTTKTTVEGDTDNGSTYSKLQLGYGLWPTAIETYGTNLVIGLCEMVNASSPTRFEKAKIAFWDTSSQNINQIIWVEFPDSLITAIKNVNGVLYVVSGNQTGVGFRISRFVGGYSFEELYYSEIGTIPLSGGVDGMGSQFLFGSSTAVPETAACVFSIGLQKGNIGKDNLFNILRSSASGSEPMVTALAIIGGKRFAEYRPVTGFYGDSYGVDSPTSDNFNSAPPVFWSQTYRIGQPFKITKIRLPLAQSMATNMTVTAKIYTDDGAGTTYTLATINNTNDPNALNIVRRSGSGGEVITGNHNFWLELRWTGSVLCTVGLPITIEYELLDD